MEPKQVGRKREAHGRFYRGTQIQINTTFVFCSCTCSNYYDSCTIVALKLLDVYTKETLPSLNIPNPLLDLPYMCGLILHVHVCTLETLVFNNSATLLQRT